ncbi:MAG: FeoA domain-containing protein [Planctomycetes bacterium]|nr:FeoA domain-containing protein [Planctomycetota bacterium]MBI3834676.1 FeoA domain-containing protein [Planctomycetota bacterium]
MEMINPDSLLPVNLSPLEPLQSLDAGTQAMVIEVKADAASAKRLADMGFVRGSVVEMLRPGKPCLVRVGNSYVGLGVGHQKRVVVQRSSSM